MRKEYKVYLIRHKESNDIKYVGLTRQTLLKRFNHHVATKNFIRSHYQIELISDNLNIIQAVELEKRLIQQYNLLEIGWNKSPGSINGSSNYHSEKQKQKWSIERKNKPVSKEHAEKNRVARLGAKNGEVWRKAQFESHAKPVMCLENGFIYSSAREAARELGLQYSKISLVCNGKRASTGNKHFIFVKKQ